MSAQDLVNQGFYGYAGWGDAEADADFRATGGKGKGGPSGSGSQGAPSLPNFTELEEKAYQASKPYYEQLVKESRGDFNRAKAILEEDYTKGVRIAKEDYFRGVANQKAEAQGAIAQLTGQNLNQQESAIDSLNKRGMAVYQQGPEGQVNALRPSTITTGFNSDTATIDNPTNQATMGRGAVELGRLQSEQALRQEAVQRTANKNIEQLGINLNRYTGMPNGETDPTKVADRSQLGEAELGKVRGLEDITRQQQVKEQQLAEQRRRESQTSAQLGYNTSADQYNQYLNNRYLQNAQTDFKNIGV